MDIFCRSTINAPIAGREFMISGNSTNTVKTVRQKDKSGPHGPHLYTPNTRTIKLKDIFCYFDFLL